MVKNPEIDLACGPVWGEIMSFEQSERSRELYGRVQAFMDAHIYPNVERYEALSHSDERNTHEGLAFINELRMKAKGEGLWNLFFPHLREDEPGLGLSNLEFAPIFEEMGKIPWAPEVFNCHAPNTGNIELLHAAANEEQREKWLRPLLEGEYTSCFAVTEPQVASSDPTNIETTIVRDGDEYVINGRKWYISRANHPDCKIMIVLGKTDPDNPSRHRQQTMLVVPMDTPGVEILKDTKIINAYHVGGHPEIRLNNVRVPVSNRLGEEGDGFAVMQKRMGPGRIHYGMRCIGMAEVAMQMMVSRSQEREAFGKPLHKHGMTTESIARSRIEIDQARLLCLHAAKVLDEVGPKEARREIGMIKIVGTEMLKNVTERAIRVHGAAGVGDGTILSSYMSSLWTMLMGDGPSEVHLEGIAKLEIANSDPEAARKFYFS